MTCEGAVVRAPTLATRRIAANRPTPRRLAIEIARIHVATYAFAFRAKIVVVTRFTAFDEEGDAHGDDSDEAQHGISVHLYRLNGGSPSDSRSRFATYGAHGSASRTSHGQAPRRVLTISPLRLCVRPPL